MAEKVNVNTTAIKINLKKYFFNVADIPSSIKEKLAVCQAPVRTIRLDWQPGCRNLSKQALDPIALRPQLSLGLPFSDY
jgi:hypothetical protein